MKRRVTTATQQQKGYYYKWKRKVFVMLLFGFCFGSLVLLQTTQYSRIFKLASSSLPSTFVQRPKIAFLFIARNRLPLDFVWDEFFQGEKENKFSIFVHSRPGFLFNKATTKSKYFLDRQVNDSIQGEKENKFSIFVHSRPGFLFNKATTKSKYFLDRQVNDSIQVDWGEASMIEAERVLLEHALADLFNERFLFLSDSCIPLYNFSYIYDYIMSTPTSFVDSFADTKEGRYNPKMAPIIPVHHWRKGSQWVVLIRKHAQVVVKDDTVLPMFQQHCKTKSLPEFWRERAIPVDSSKEHNCIPDEHYVQTLLAHEGLEGEITQRMVTHTSWDLTSSKARERRGWHPVTYKFSDAAPQLIQSIREIDNIYYETEYRREWCTSMGKPSLCFFLQGNSLGLLLFGFLICLRLELSTKPRENPNYRGVNMFNIELKELLVLTHTKCDNHGGVH